MESNQRVEKIKPGFENPSRIKQNERAISIDIE
jgi:hypothetical protein